MFSRLKASLGWNSGRQLRDAIASIDANFQSILKVRSSAAANYVLQADDRFVRATKADAAQAITVPANATVAFDIGTRIRVEADTAQVATITAAGGVTLRKLATKSLAIAGQYGVVTLEKVAVNEWIVSGDLAAV